MARPTPLAIAAAVLLAAATTTVGAADSDCQLPQNLKYTGFSLKIGTGCKEYVHCQNGVVSSARTCPANTLYDGDVGQGGICNWESLVECKDETIEAASETPPPSSSPTKRPSPPPTGRPIEASTPNTNANDNPTNNPGKYFCGINKRDAERNCAPCPSGSLSECVDRTHGCFGGVAANCGSTGGSLSFGGSTATGGSLSFGVSTGGGYSSGGNALELASKLRLVISMQKNFDHGADCSMADWGLCHTQTLTLEYTGDRDYSDNRFKIYFSSIHRVLEVNHPAFEHEHVVGDLTYIKPTSSFQGFQSEAKIVLPLVIEYWSVQESDNMPRWFVVDNRDQSTAVIENTHTESLRNFVLPYTSTLKTATDANVHMTTANRFSLNKKTVEEVDAGDRIIPTPYHTIIANDARTFDIRGIYLENWQLLDNLRIGATDLLWKLGVSASGDHKVAFALGSLPPDTAGTESYTMKITTARTTITGSHARGLFHGLMSFIGLLDIADTRQMTLKEMIVYDKPRFEYRGHQVDVARNFRSKEAIMKTIDAMALWKLNVLHLALTNDEGWRLEIPGLEELTSVGSKRCFDPSERTCLLSQLGSGPDAEEQQYYTREDYIELLKYAAQRNVQVLPEFNMPAHARAAVISMEARAKNGDDSYRLSDPKDETFLLTIQFYDRTSIINPCLDSSVRFVEKLVGEVKKMHDEAGIPLDSYHFGGDEAKNILLGAGYSSYSDDLKQQPFSKSPACQAKSDDDPSFDIEKIANYWAITVNKILARNGIKEMVAWEDGLRGTTKVQYETESVAVDFWETLFWGGIDGLAAMADDGFDIIMSNPDYLYFDFPYEVDPMERGYYWAARFNSVYKVFTFAPENLAQNAETSVDRDGNEMSVTTPGVPKPKIRGMQGQTWSETIRTDEQYYEMAFPRVLAVAERAWHRASWELDWSPGTVFNTTSGHVRKDELATDYNGFVSALGCREVFKLEKLGITYRLPPPGASIDSSGVLAANSEMPCTDTMYSIDEGNTWSKYSVPVEVGVGKVASMQSMSSSGVLMSRIVVIDEECNDCGDDVVSSDLNDGNVNKDPSSPTNGNSQNVNRDPSPTTTDQNIRQPGVPYMYVSNCANSLIGTTILLYLISCLSLL